MKIAFVAPSCEEIAPFNALLTDLQHSKQAGYDFYDGFYMGEKVSGVLCGIGKVNATIATMLLIEKTHPDLIILGGVCGAIDDRLNVGDAVICEKVKHHDVADRFLTDNPPYYESACFKADDQAVEKIREGLKKEKFDFDLYYGKLATGEQFIEDDGREEIKANINPLGVDMETAAFAQACVACGVRFVALRTVTDTPKERGLNAFHKNLEKAVVNEGKVLEKIFAVLKK